MTLLELTRNFGKEAAMLAGLDYADERCAAAMLIDSIFSIRRSTFQRW